MQGAAGVYCHATLNYSGGETPIPVEVPIRDGREAGEPPVLETCGFERLEHASRVEDWRDPSHLAAVHAPEIEALARERSGADRVLVYPPIVRSPAMEREVADYHPIEFVHSDFTDDFGAMIADPERPYRAFIEPLLERAGLTQRDLARAERVVMLQFWRNVGPRRPDRPLALCDARTVPSSALNRFVVPEYGGRRLEFETYGVRPPARADEHRWYTYPGMAADEVVALRTYDSRCVEARRPFWTPHSAFRDPHAGAGAAPRESVEMRALCLFGI